MSDISSAAKTNEADRLMSSGDTEKAKSILMELLDNTDDRGTYGDAVSIFMAGNMYAEAKEVFEKYERRTGKSLEGSGGADFVLKDLERLLQDKASPAADGEWFKALPFLFKGPSGAGINFGRLWNYTEIGVLPDKLVLRKGSTECALTWSDITEARLVSKEMGGDSSGYINHIYLNTKDGKSFHFKLVPNSPSNFENEGRILPALKQHIKFSETRKNVPRFWVSIAVILAVSLLISAIRRWY